MDSLHDEPVPEPRDDPYTEQRERMVREQIEGRGIHDAAVLAAIRAVPREKFVPDAHRHLAYSDSPLPIGKKQTISQPYVVGYMIDQLDLQPGDRVLEVGTGSGYAAAVLSHIVAEVYTIERHRLLAANARENLEAAGYAHIHLKRGDGTKGWPEHAPYDAIIVAAGGPFVPQTLQGQLAIGGRLIMPVGSSHYHQNLVLVTRTGNDTTNDRTLSAVAFVPLVGDEGW